MDSKKIRDNFFNFFESKQHKLIPSASLIVKNDPTTFGSFKENYKIVINEENTTLEKKYITTEHIKIVKKTILEVEIIMKTKMSNYNTILLKNLLVKIFKMANSA